MYGVECIKTTNQNIHDLNSAQGLHVIYLYIKPIYIY